MIVDITHDGQTLNWQGHGSFKATSGLPEYQSPAFQCFIDKGPIPEGLYSIELKGGDLRAQDDGTDMCRLAPSFGLQTIPRGEEAGECETVWANWGRSRVRLRPADPGTARRCSPKRAGFYLHDSTKGYTHGCIEVEGRFFEVLRSAIGALQGRRPRNSVLNVRVRYVPGKPTNGGTATP